MTKYDNEKENRKKRLTNRKTTQHIYSSTQVPHLQLRPLSRAHVCYCRFPQPLPQRLQTVWCTRLDGRVTFSGLCRQTLLPPHLLPKRSSLVCFSVKDCARRCSPPAATHGGGAHGYVSTAVGLELALFHPNTLRYLTMIALSPCPPATRIYLRESCLCHNTCHGVSPCSCRGSVP